MCSLAPWSSPSAPEGGVLGSSGSALGDYGEIAAAGLRAALERLADASSPPCFVTSRCT